MKFQTNYPIYLQIADDIKRKIVVGELHPGDKLPSNIDLALQYEVNPNTAVRIYKELEQESIFFTKRGIGTFLTEDPGMPDRLKREIVTKLAHDFLETMRQYHLSNQEISQILQQEMNRGEEESYAKV